MRSKKTLVILQDGIDKGVPHSSEGDEVRRVLCNLHSFLIDDEISPAPRKPFVFTSYDGNHLLTAPRWITA